MGLGALRSDESRHLVRQAEQVHGLIEQVSSQVVDCTAARDHSALPRGCRGLFGTVAVEMAFEFDDPAQRAFADELGEGDKIGVEAAIYSYHISNY